VKAVKIKRHRIQRPDLLSKSTTNKFLGPRITCGLQLLIRNLGAQTCAVVNDLKQVISVVVIDVLVQLRENDFVTGIKIHYVQPELN
jgi:hypothetical protein